MNSKLLYNACCNGDLNTLQTHFNEGIVKNFNIIVNDRSEETPLMVAIRHKQLHVVEYLLNFKETNVDIRNICGATALIITVATEIEDIRYMKLLIDRKCNVNIADNDQNTALHWVCRYGPIEQLKLLLQANADITLTNFLGNTAGQIARIHSICIEEPELYDLLGV